MVWKRGCSTLVLTPEGNSYRLITKILISRTPIRTLRETSHGWKSLVVWVQGGGIVSGYESELRFNGTTYPISPANPPAVRLTEEVAGDTVIDSTADSKPLFP